MANAISEIKERHAAANQQIKVTAQNVGEIYEDVRLRLNQRLQAFVLSGDRNKYRGKALVDCIEAIGRIYHEFEENFREEMGRAVPYVAESYYQDALHDMGEKITGKFDTKRAEVMLQDSYSHIAGATEFMSATQVGNLRNTVSRVLRTAGMTGMTSREVQGELLRLLTADFTFTDAKGRVWNTEAYTKMLARTTLMNAGREAYLDTCADKGKDVVRISISGDACPKCAEWENRLVSLSGKTKGLPLLQDAIDGGLFHPNCTHSTVAVGDWDRETKFDKNGRPKEGWNSAKNPNPKGDDPDANREYRKRQAKKAAAKAVDEKYRDKIDKHWNKMPQEQRQALKDYTDSDVHGLNKALRLDNATTEQLKQIELLEKTLDEYPKYKGDTYRGMNFQTEEERQRILDLIESNGLKPSFWSTSVNPKVADRYIYKTGKTFTDPTKNYPIVITYKNTTKGAYIGHHSSVPTDQEVLFSDEVKFELLDKQEKDGILYLTMQERSE